MQDENYQLLAKHVMITELSSLPKEETTTTTVNKEADKYFLEEPFDYIFEPEHYPSAEKKAKLNGNDN